MSGSADETFPELTEMTSDIVAAYVSNNHVAIADLPALIAGVYTTLGTLVAGGRIATEEEPVEKLTAAQIRKSVTQDALISFIDGKPYKTLKRHLTKHGIDPASYRERYGLPADYPMVAPSYSEKRSNLAKSLGLGQAATRGARPEEAKPAPKGRKAA